MGIGLICGQQASVPLPSPQELRQQTRLCFENQTMQSILVYGAKSYGKNKSWDSKLFFWVNILTIKKQTNDVSQKGNMSTASIKNKEKQEPWMLLQAILRAESVF